MNKKEYIEFIKRYDKFKRNNLPTPFFDKERQAFEYVYYNANISKVNRIPCEEESELCVHSSLTEALENVAFTGMYYPFTCRIYIHTKENGKTIQKTEIGHNHAHSFESVVSHLYDSPESFSISKEEEEYYSKQELQYLRRVQKYLLFIGMSDLDVEKKTIQRYRNKREKRYLHQYIYSYSEETIQEFTTGKRSFTVRNWYKGCPEYREYTPKEYRVLIADSEDNFRLYVEFTHREIKRYKEIKDKFRNNTFKDNDKVIVTYFKVLEVF